MRVSVAMATYNGERFLSEQLASIAQQSRLPNDLVISDDASSDATLAIAHDFAKRAPFRVLILANRHHVGFADNFLRAARRCCGELIAFSDQDDVWHRDKLAVCSRAFGKHAQLALVAHSAQVTDDSLRPQGWRHPHIPRQRRLPPGTLAPLSGYSGFALMFRARYIRDVDAAHRPRRTSAYPADPLEHDHWVSLVCSAFGDVLLLPECLAVHRRHHSNTSTADRMTTFRRLRQTITHNTEVTTYLSTSRMARERHAYLSDLRGVARSLGPSARDGLERAIAAHDRYAHALQHRATLYSQRSASRRITHIAANVAHRHYSRRSRGGLGALSLARDVALLLQPSS